MSEVPLTLARDQVPKELGLKGPAKLQAVIEYLLTQKVALNPAP